MQRTEIPLTLNKLEDDSYHVLIKDTTLSDKINWYWVVDSGASRTVLHESFDSYFSQDPSSENEELNGIGCITYSKVGTIGQLELEGSVFKNVNCNSTNLRQLQQLYQEKTPYQICGMLGCDFLLRTKAMLDFDKLCLHIFVK